jgi:predicted CXXCH cytochrome family protein
MILYRRNFTAATGPSVECGSCHDPHNYTNPTFLRVANNTSNLCLSCHTK